MSEPITLHDGAGNTLTVYTRSQAEGLLSGGQWFATEAEAQAAPPAPLVTTGAAVFGLGPAAVGAELTFVVMTAQELRIDPSGTETIALPSSGAQGAAGKYLTADAVGEWVRLLCVKAGQWQVIGYAGTWAHEG